MDEEDRGETLNGDAVALNKLRDEEVSGSAQREQCCRRSKLAEKVPPWSSSVRQLVCVGLGRTHASFELLSICV